MTRPDTGILLPSHPAQAGLIAAHGRQTHALNCTCAYRVTGALDSLRLARAYERALASFDALRLEWVPLSPGLGWRSTAGPRATVRCTDLRCSVSPHPSDEGEAAIRARLQRHAAHRFDLGGGPAALVEIMRVRDQEWIVSEAIDHTLADGRSLALLHDAVAACYRDPQHVLPQQPSYTEHLVTSAQQPTDRSRSYWQRAFADFTPPPSGAQHRPSAAAARWEWTLDATQAADLQRAAGRLRSTLSSALVAAHAHAVARHLGTGDIATHLAMDSRQAADQNLFGQLTVLAPLRVRHSWENELGRHVTAVARAMLQMREYLDIDVSALDALGVPVSVGRPDATVFVMQNLATAPLELPGTYIAALPVPSTEQAGGLVTVVRRRPDHTVHLSLTAPAGSVLAPLLTSIGQTLQATVIAVADRPAEVLSSDALLPPDSQAVIKQLATATPPYPFAPVDADILQQLETAGRRTVVDDGEQPCSARTLLRRVRAYEDQLRAARIDAGHVVAVDNLPVAERIAAYLAVLHLGAVYVPLATSGDRPARLPRGAARLSDSGLDPGTGLRLGEGPLGPQSPAYVVHTSGTTGNAKGVVVSRASLANLVRGEQERFGIGIGIGTGSRLLLVAPPTVDPWICHVTSALLHNATLVPARPLSDRPLAQQMRSGRVTHAFLPAALLRSLDSTDLPDLQVIATAGDYCQAEDLRPFTTQRVFNIYGPTEATVTASVAEITEATDPVPIGRPIHGTSARVVIDQVASAPLGVIGELLLGGVGIALGYLGEEELTSRAFPALPHAPHERGYLTGDRAYVRPGCELVLCGRVDRQVKIRGSRVEPEAIEAAARATGLCRDAHAKAYPSPSGPDRLLVLFAERCPDAAALSVALQAALPPAARPHHIAVMPRLPRHDNGKVDDVLLPQHYAQATGQSTEDPSPPAHPLARSWATVLGTAPAPDHQFFAQGGDSLNVLRLVRQARAAGLQLSPADVYAHPRYQDLKQLCADRSSSNSAKGATSLGGPIPLGPAQRWFLALGLPEPQRWNQRHIITFSRLPPDALLRQALNGLVATTPLLGSALDLQSSSFIPHLAAVPLTRLPAKASDQELLAALNELSCRINPFAGSMLAALAVSETDDSGALILIAHHLVVDIWSWSVIEDRLRQFLRDPAAVKTTPRDHGFAQFARSVQQQCSAGAFHLDAAVWRQILSSGTTTDFATRPKRLERAERTIAVPQHLVRRLQAPLSRVALAALGHALLAVAGPGHTVIDLERNGRMAAGGDLSNAVGWIALHHPVTLEHTLLTGTAVQHLSQAIDAVPDFGLGYGALRWSGRADLGRRVGRFAVDVSADQPPDAAPKTLADRVRALPLSLTGINQLPYEGTFTIRPSGDSLRVVLDYDPRRMSCRQAEAVLNALAEATHSQHDPPATRKRPRTDPFDQPVPASAMQHLMLHQTGSSPGVYVPRQLLSLGRLPQPDAFLDALSTFLGTLEPLRRRFHTSARGQVMQTWLPPRPCFPLQHHGGGRDSALAWFSSTDSITRESALSEGPLIEITAFTGEDQILLGMELHHALLDGVSNQHLLALLERFVHAFRTGAPRPAAPGPSPDRAAWRKHIASELATQQQPPSLPAPPSVGLDRPVTATADVPRTQLDALRAWGQHHDVDLRAALAAVAAQAAADLLGTATMHVVANGRDADIPGAAEAFGMYWYFLSLPLKGQDLAATARIIYQAAAQPLAEVRAGAAGWPTWPVDSVAFNFTKHPATETQRSSLQRIDHRDVFHYRAQIDVAVGNDGSARIRCTATQDPHAVLPLLNAVVNRIATAGNR
ncbi:condensation domain-containing protein [Streptomyces sp. NPDC056061]|uniref:condensation domain-containing protein n=1 Tax=Streptomyces sp. NPDC056061 TaxID=3345700 RepID=UPI0035E1E8DC